jgi:hypothetical protein
MSPDPPMKAKTHRLFEKDEPVASSSGPRRSFEECLRTTPADPLSPVLKAALWVVGTLVVLLLIAALATGGGKKPGRAPAARLGPPPAWTSRISSHSVIAWRSLVR